MSHFELEQTERGREVVNIADGSRLSWVRLVGQERPPLNEFLFERGDHSFKFAATFNGNGRHARRLFSNQTMSEASWKARLDAQDKWSSKNRDLRDWEVRTVDAGVMPLDENTVEALLRMLFFYKASGDSPWKVTACLVNSDPEASWRKIPPKFEIDIDGDFARY